MRHLDDEQLLRFSDGELSARATRKARAHLEACWQCRTELENLQRTVSECVRYHRNVVVEYSPPPPLPWCDLFLRMEEMDARRTIAGRFRDALQLPFRHVRRWAPVAVALAVAGVMMYQWREPRPVQAAELLRKAVAAAEARPAAPRRLQIRMKGRQVTRVIGSARKTAVTRQDSDVRALFEAAHYDWDDPLNPRAFQNWRQQLPAKRDQVTSGPDFYRISTSAETGVLREASLKLHTPDLRPLEGRFEFRNREWVEVTELPPEPPAPVAIASAPPAPRVRTAVPVSSSPEPAGVADELRVMAALHQVGADLGDPIDITRQGSHVVVSGVGIPAQRRQQIEHALASDPRVVVRFDEPTADTGQPPVAAAPEGLASNELSGLQARIAREAGGRAQFERLSSQLLDMSEAMMARVYALRRLARRFPREAEAQLDAGQRRVLYGLAREHAAALGREAAGMQRVLVPLLGLQAQPPNQTVAGGWQSAAGAVLAPARRVETLLAVLTGAAPADTAAAGLPSQLLAALAQVRAEAAGCERAAARE